MIGHHPAVGDRTIRASTRVATPAMSVPVNVDNFARAETERMFAGLQRDAGGVNVLSHDREPASVVRRP